MDAERAFAVSDELYGQNAGSAAEVNVDSENDCTHVVTFQTSKMKRMFSAFSKVVVGDSTPETITNRYKLFSFVLYDVFGKV